MSSERRRRVARAGCAALLVLVTVGCGARAQLRTPRDASGPPPRDGGSIPDARPPVPPDLGPDFGPPPIPDASVLRACFRDADCSADLCRADFDRIGVDLDPVPLVCGARGPGAPDGAPCVTATDCGRGLCAVAGRCLVPCVSDAECASSARCAEVYVRTAAGSLQPNDACIPRFEAPPGTRAAAVSFTFDAAAGDATAPTLRHAMGGVSQLVVEESRPEVDVQLGIVSLRCAGRTLWDPFVFSPTSPPPLNAVSARDDVANVFLPLGPGAAALPTCDTELVLRAQTPGTGPVALHGFSALSDGSFRGGVVDLDLYFVGGGGFTGDAGLPAPLRAALDDAQRILLARVGVRFGDIRLHEVVGGLRARFAVLEAVGDPISFPDLAALFRLGGGTPTRSVDVFLLRDLTPALGVAGGIPGPSGAHGYGGSGIAIGVDGVAQTMGEYPLGRVLAHELGHFLGLFHTSEADGSVFDPLPDTPECRLAPNDRDGDGVLTPSECAGTGGDHLMFWSAGGDAVSDGQRAVLARALVFR